MTLILSMILSINFDKILFAKTTITFVNNDKTHLQTFFFFFVKQFRISINKQF